MNGKESVPPTSLDAAVGGLEKRGDGELLKHAGIKPILVAVDRYKWAVITTYLLLMASLLAVCVFSYDLILRAYSPAWFNTAAQGVNLWEGIWIRVIIAVLFLATQVAFLFGGGKLSIGTAPVRWPRRIVALGLFGIVMTLVLAGCALVASEMMTVEVTEVQDFAKRFIGWWLICLVPIWGIWVIFGWLLVKQKSAMAGLGRLVSVMVSGTWLQVAAALPVDLASRDRHSSCPCESPTFVALFIGIPLLLWAFGPGLFLIYWKERKCEREQPGHARRILQRKSRRSRPEPA